MAMFPVNKIFLRYGELEWCPYLVTLYMSGYLLMG